MAPTPWAFPPAESLATEDDLIAFGADLEPATLIEAYRSGYFPMPIPGSPLRRRRIGWFCPYRRGVLEPNELIISRSLRRSVERFSTSVDQAFDEVIRACADPGRPHGWIDRSIIEAYSRLFRLGVAHSIEVWDGDELAGGLYGVALGGLFAGESMFHRRSDASKVALVHLVELVGPASGRLIDVQWLTPHLASLGCRELSRADYAHRLNRALALGLPAVFANPPIQGRMSP